VRGNGDGGADTTVADMRRFWTALFANEILPPDVVAEMTRPHASAQPDRERRYGLGFWLRDTAVELEGGDYGVSFRSSYDRASGVLCTVIANVETRIRPVFARVAELLAR
jgi:CubicO group peptidase (beta-lactamase class C family)